ncbi:MAG: hypothetical protein HW421_3606 [Ignavibacteria bacterium]|nr:hypothetical protein [Ignavibacteria bacterium]
MFKNLTIAIAVLLFTATAYSQPKLDIIGGDTHDWGKVKPKDSPLTTKIKIVNTGDKKLIINEVKPGCGCTTAPLDKKELEQGDTATMSVSLNLGAGGGAVTKSISIMSNDPVGEGRRILWLKANVFRAVEVNPISLYFNEMHVGTEATAKVTIKNNTQEAVKISDFVLSPENIKINLQGVVTIEPQASKELAVTVKPDKKDNFNCNIKFKTDNAEYPEINVGGYGMVKESPIFTPSK